MFSIILVLGEFQYITMDILINIHDILYQTNFIAFQIALWMGNFYLMR